MPFQLTRQERRALTVLVILIALGYAGWLVF
jgi:hypothetical protein